jgi:hypothetical protein
MMIHFVHHWFHAEKRRRKDEFIPAKKRQKRSKTAKSGKNGRLVCVKKSASLFWMHG